MNKDPNIKRSNPLRDLSKWASDINPSVFLFVAAILAIIFANTGLSGIYSRILDAPVNLEIGQFKFFQVHGRTMTLSEFINDALMALFFFNVGLEIKREIVCGSLSTVRKALLPVIAACGGMIMPVLIFLLIENQDPIALRGMAIPMATDIAFSLAVLGLLGSKVPSTLKVFLMALAVVDDIGGILVIAIFYSSGINWIPLILGLFIILLSVYLSKKGVVKSSIYYLLLFIVWSFFMHSGIHSTIAGVLLALTIPYKPTVRPDELEQDLRKIDARVAIANQTSYSQRIFLNTDQLEDIRRAEKRLHRTISPVQVMEHEVTPIVNYIVLPLFAFANSGITFGNIGHSDAIGLAFAVALGLLIGKTVGIFGFTYLFSKLKVVSLTPGITHANLFGISIFGGIGFTVSLFIASLAYSNIGPETIEYLNMAKMGIILGTVLSGIIGVVALSAVLKHEEKRHKGGFSDEYLEYVAQTPIK